MKDVKLAPLLSECVYPLWISSAIVLGMHGPHQTTTIRTEVASIPLALYFAVPHTAESVGIILLCVNDFKVQWAAWARPPHEQSCGVSCGC